MDEKIIDRVILVSEKLKEEVKKYKYKREFFNLLKTNGDFFIGIKGLRGVGKTTLLLQKASQLKNSVYFSADAIYLKPFSIYEIVKELSKRGFEYFFIDEIHSKKDFSYDLKTLYDEGFRNIFFSGSSSIDLEKADLSRRAVIYNLPIASLREYLIIKYNFKIKKLSINDLFNLEKRKKILISYSKYYEYYKEYLMYGGVLYSKDAFYERIGRSIKKAIYSDLAYLREIDVKVEEDIFNLLYIIASSSPFEVSYSKIASSLGISKNTAIKLVSDLEKANLLYSIFPCAYGYKKVRKEPKLYLPIPFRYFFYNTYGIPVNEGSLNEEFFVNCLNGKLCYLKEKKKADFIVNNKVIEVGSKGKKVHQKFDYLVKDGLEIDEKVIPLFLFGFLY